MTSPTRIASTVQVDHFTYRVSWSAEDREHVATVAEFPSLSWLAPTQAEALDGIVTLVGEVIHDLAAAGEPVPEPLADRSYSGKLQLRLGPALHRRLAAEAAEEGLSLNSYITRRLA